MRLPWRGVLVGLCPVAASLALALMFPDFRLPVLCWPVVHAGSAPVTKDKPKPAPVQGEFFGTATLAQAPPKSNAYVAGDRDIWLMWLNADDCLDSLKPGPWASCHSPRHVRITVKDRPGFLEVNREDGSVRTCKGDIVAAEKCEEEPRPTPKNCVQIGDTAGVLCSGETWIPAGGLTNTLTLKVRP